MNGKNKHTHMHTIAGTPLRTSLWRTRTGEALELMGWDSRAWDSGDVRVGLFGSTGWNLLTREQQVIAGLLGFSMETWGPSAQAKRGQPIWPAWTAAATRSRSAASPTCAAR